MTRVQVVAIMRTHIERQFPKTCTRCGRQFANLADYLRNTKHLGEPISYDVESGNWVPPLRPLGTLSMANCACGTTLSISSRGMRWWTLFRLLRWARGETRAHGITMPALLAQLRDEIDALTLAE